MYHYTVDLFGVFSCVKETIILQNKYAIITSKRKQRLLCLKLSKTPINYTEMIVCA